MKRGHEKVKEGRWERAFPVSGTFVICDDERNGKKKPAFNSLDKIFKDLSTIDIYIYIFQDDRRRKGRKHGGGAWFVCVFLGLSSCVQDCVFGIHPIYCWGSLNSFWA